MKLSEAILKSYEYPEVLDGQNEIIRLEEDGKIKACVLGRAYIGEVGTGRKELLDATFSNISKIFPVLEESLGGKPLMDALWMLNDGANYLGIRKESPMEIVELLKAMNL